MKNTLFFLLALLLSSVPATVAQNSVGDYFDFGKLPYLKSGKLIQISSNDTSGGNADFVPIGIGQTKVLADIQGAGVIARIWVTIGAEDKYFLRTLLVRMYWDGEANPSVECPVGDFFGNGFQYTQWTSLPLGMSSGGYYCYFPMPFSNGARIEIVNESGLKVNSFYYHIDYHNLDSLKDPNVGRFHAQWRREPRTDPKKNYLVLDAEGKGQYVGTLLEMQGYREKQLWFLEGDEFVYVDGEEKPSIKGTGTEDYFTSGWYFSKGTYSAPLHGLILKDDTLWSRVVAYRFHLGDQIPFGKSIRFTIEHGHGNEELADYSSVGFWYQAEPHKPFEPILTAARRIPLRVVVPEGAVEAEGLIANAEASGGKLEVQDMSTLGVDWSNDKQLLFRSSDANGYFTVRIPVKEPDKYTISAYITKDSVYGKMEAWINGKKVGEFDGYSKETLPGGKTTFDKVRLTDSAVAITFKATGKDPLSKGFYVGLDAFTLSPDRNFVRQWYVIGPFENQGDIKVRNGLKLVFGPEKETKLKKSYIGKNGADVKWKSFTGSADGYVDFNDALKPNDLAVGYALSYVYSQIKKNVNVYLGTDDGVRMWLNDKLVYDTLALRGANVDDDTLNVQLEKGWNKILLKVENNLGGWGFFCRIPNPNDDLIFNTSPSLSGKKKK